ncbi:hypothetical protein HU200_011517 [Digitaria exilis]|uniref:Cytochrome P450 n=1 Tax=Digitaria exilis TaxID=1010633 RepID=A0A835FFQ0_9POAL|nr:hypothetical protein HU200_011517 [Digitaria exilis]
MYARTFRLHPVAPFNVPHVALEDATVSGYHIPKGSHVILSRIGLGRNPGVWDDPLRFNPDRHSPPLIPWQRLLQGFSWRKPAGISAVDLSELRHDIFMAKPLVLHAEPRLPAHLYSALSVEFM